MSAPTSLNRIVTIFCLVLLTMDVTMAGRRRKKNNGGWRNTPQPSLQPTEDIDCTWMNSYYNEDNPTDDNIDDETIDTLISKGNNVCYGETPIDIECLSVDSNVDFYDYSFGRLRNYDELFCTPEEGYKCEGKRPNKRCPDFKVKFCCPYII